MCIRKQVRERPNTSWLVLELCRKGVFYPSAALYWAGYSFHMKCDTSRELIKF